MIISLSSNLVKDVIDIYIPADITCSKFTSDFVELYMQLYHKSLDINRLRVVINRLNKVISSNETFENAGVWNGDFITVFYE